MTRFVPVTVLVMVLAGGRVASADKGMLPNGAALSWDALYIQENGGNFREPSEPEARRYYFNLAHCQCSKAGAGSEQNFEYLLKLSQVTNTNRPAELWVGTTCDDNANRATMCRKLADPTLSDIDAVASREVRLRFSIFDVFSGLGGASCPMDETDKTIYLLMDTDANNDIDYALDKNVGQAPGTTAVGVDLNPPPPLDSPSADPTDGGIVVRWNIPTSRANDLYYYQALCADANGNPVKSNPPEPRYRNAATLCARPQDDTPLAVTELAVPADAPDAGALVMLPGQLQQLDPTYICGESAQGTSTQLSIDGLENGKPYTVVLIAADLHGNYFGTYFSRTITPVPSTDFWEDLHGRGSDVEGGLCLLAETYGDDSGLTRALRAFRDDTLGESALGRWLADAYYASLARLGSAVHGSTALRIVAAIALAPLVALALLWHGLTLPGMIGFLAAAWWLRRRGVARRWLARLGAMRAVPAAAALAVIALGAGPAHAGGYQPYWENADIASADVELAADDPGLVTWHAGIRIGPYLPDVDDQFGTSPGPFKQMFGDARPMPMLDVDRILWTGYGQVGIGVSAGYMQWFAHTFDMDSSPTDPDRLRARGDVNRFRLIPMAVTATYRFTALDDDYGIPIVPYARAGLAYYLWWVSRSDGSLAKICETADSCGNRALGGSLGVTGSIGVAVRAERIDTATAISMRASGIQHAGIYAELSLAKVDDFGSGNKLSVGDRTWFAGVNFEF